MECDIMPTVSVYIDEESYLLYIKNKKYWNNQIKDIFRIVKDE